jgi:hypothetical protein
VVSSTVPSVAVYYRLDTMMGQWQGAAVTNSAGVGTATVSVSAVPRGTHILYVFASYGDEESETQGSGRIGSSPMIGNPDCIDSTGASCVVPFVFVEESDPIIGLDIEPAGSDIYLELWPYPSWQACGYSAPPQPTGTVYFYDQSTQEFLPGVTVSLSTATWNGTWWQTSGIPYTGAGDEWVAVYLGDVNYQPATSGVYPPE